MLDKLKFVNKNKFPDLKKNNVCFVFLISIYSKRIIIILIGIKSKAPITIIKLRPCPQLHTVNYFYFEIGKYLVRDYSLK